MTDTDAFDTSAPPSGVGCADCLGGTSPGWWVHLRRCARCGHIGCCDSSPGRHATGHPVIQSFEPDENWYFDYRSGGLVDGPQLAPPTSHPADQGVPGGAVPADWQDQLG